MSPIMASSPQPAIKTADGLVTIATDSAALCGSERQKFLAAHYPDGFDEVDAAVGHRR
jgi:hypothetical protein